MSLKKKAKKDKRYLLFYSSKRSTPAFVKDVTNPNERATSNFSDMFETICYDRPVVLALTDDTDVSRTIGVEVKASKGTSRVDKASAKEEAGPRGMAVAKQNKTKKQNKKK